MQTKLNKLIEIFETEQWYFIDKTISEDRKKFWETKFEQYPQLKDILIETQKLNNTFSDLPEIDIDETSLNVAIKKAVKETFLEKVKNVFRSFISTEEESGKLMFPKIAFGAILVVVAFVLIFTSENQNPIKNISQELLSWEDDSFSKGIHNINNSFALDQSDEYQKYMSYKISQDEWLKSFYQLQSKVKKLKKEINNISL